MYSSDPPRSHETRVSLFLVTLASSCDPEGRRFEPRRSPNLEVPLWRQGRSQSERPGGCAERLSTAILLQSALVRPSEPAYQHRHNHPCWQLCGLLIRSSQVRILPITQGHGSLRPTLESYVEYLKRYNSPKWYVDILRGAWSEDQTYLAQGVDKS